MGPAKGRNSSLCSIFVGFVETMHNVSGELNMCHVKQQSRYRPGMAQRVPESLGSQIS